MFNVDIQGIPEILDKVKKSKNLLKSDSREDINVTSLEVTSFGVSSITRQTDTMTRQFEEDWNELWHH